MGSNIFGESRTVYLPPEIFGRSCGRYTEQMVREQIHFVTGRLAERALRETLNRLSAQFDFGFTLQVMPITVAALMTGSWVARRLAVPVGTTRVILPGYCDSELELVRQAAGIPVDLGPRDLRDLGTCFDPHGESVDPDDWSRYDVEILAEINHVPKLSEGELLRIARELREAGADWIDLGCDPAGGWLEIGERVRRLKDEGFRVSIDSFDVQEVRSAVAAGAELVLSAQGENRQALADLGAELVVVPDDLRQWERMEETIEFLELRGVPFRIDPILEPIGIGFAKSLERYFLARQRWPSAAMLMGVGNLTEMSDSDSAGINLLLIAVCQELGIGSVLTTQVINWARSSIAECDVARRLCRLAIDRAIPAKRLSDRLVMLRDPRLLSFGREQLEELAGSIKDRNVRIFAEPDGLFALAEGHWWQDSDAFALFEKVNSGISRPIDASHAFYLGYELCKAELARRLGKQYEQDEPLRWGVAGGDDSLRQHRMVRRSPGDSSGAEAEKK